MRVVFLCHFVHLDGLLLIPANFELRITIFRISLEGIVNSFKFLFETSPPRIVVYEMLSVLQFCRAEHLEMSPS